MFSRENILFGETSTWMMSKSYYKIYIKFIKSGPNWAQSLAQTYLRVASKNNLISNLTYIWENLDVLSLKDIITWRQFRRNMQCILMIFTNQINF